MPNTPYVKFIIINFKNQKEGEREKEKKNLRIENICSLLLFSLIF